MQTVFITGIGKGIGRALAETFLKKGDRVIGTSLTGEIDINNSQLIVLPLDLALPDSVKKCVQEVESLHPQIDVFINNAGVLLDEENTEVDPVKLRATLEINLVGTADLTEHLLPFLAPNAHIVFVTSTAGSLEKTGRLESHFPGHYPAYKISKAALNMYMRTLSMRLKEKGIMVSAVHPGWVRTDMGGPEADLSPEEAAEDICAFSNSCTETGGFWYKGAPLPW